MFLVGWTALVLFHQSVSADLEHVVLPPDLLGGEAGYLSNNGSIAVFSRWPKKLNVWDLRSGKNLYSENLFATLNKRGKLAFLTDSQIAHERSSVRIITASFGRVAPVGQDNYLGVAELNGRIRLVLIRPGMRGKEPNLVLDTQVGKMSNSWLWFSKGEARVAVLREGARRDIMVWTYRNGAKPIVSTYPIRSGKDHRVEVSPGARRYTQFTTTGPAAEFSFSGSKLRAIPSPPEGFIDHYIGAVPTGFKYPKGPSYVFANEKWRKLDGMILARALDGTQVMVRHSDRSVGINQIQHQ